MASSASAGIYPAAIQNPINGYFGGSFVPGALKRGVLHSTETGYAYSPRADGSYFGGASPPHFTVAVNGVFQHINTNRSCYALENRAGGVETNREGCIQIEVCGRAVDAPDWPEATYRNLAQLMRWVEEECGVDSSYIDGGHYYPPEDGWRLGQEPWRVSYGSWPFITCWVGHQHCPENVHGDPGKVRLDLLFPEKANPIPMLITDTFEETDMVHTLLGSGNSNAFGVSNPSWDPGFNRPPVFVAAAPNGLVQLRTPIGGHVEGNSVVLDISMVSVNGEVLGAFDVHVTVA